MPEQQYCLRWNNHHPNNVSVFSNLLYNELLVDVTLVAEGAEIQAHKLVLSACSTSFQRMFIKNPCRHPIIILKDVEAEHLKIIIDFIYQGEVNCTQEQLPEVLKIADMLKVKGLTEVSLMKNASQTTKAPRAEQPMNYSDSHVEMGQSESRNVRPGPKKQLKTASFQTNQMHSPDTNTDETLALGGSNKECGNTDAGEQENSNDSVEVQPQSPDDDENSNDLSQQVPLMMTTAAVEEVEVNQPQTFSDNYVKDTYESNATGECRDSLNYSVDKLTIRITPDMYNQCNNYQIEQNMGMAANNSTENNMNFIPQHFPAQALSLNYTIQNVPSTNLQIQNIAEQSNPFIQADVKDSITQMNSAAFLEEQKLSVEQQKPVKKRCRNGKIDKPNLLRAIEAVRQGMGFCRAARIFSVNNRTLWLEYQKRGYPSKRDRVKTLSIDATN